MTRRSVFLEGEITVSVRSGATFPTRWSLNCPTAEVISGLKEHPETAHLIEHITIHRKPPQKLMFTQSMITDRDLTADGCVKIIGLPRSMPMVKPDLTSTLLPSVPVKLSLPRSITNENLFISMSSGMNSTGPLISLSDD